MRLAWLFAACALTLPAQVRKEFKPSWPASAQDFQEIATVIRTVFDVRTVNIDSESGTLQVQASPEQIRETEWLFHELDMPEELRERAPHELTASGTTPQIRAVFLKTTGPRFTREVLTTIRTVAGTQKIFNVTRQNVLVLRDEKQQADLAVWIAKELDSAAAAPPKGYSGVHEFTQLSGPQSNARIFFAEDQQHPDFALLLKQVRSEVKTTLAFVMTKPSALVVRGTPDQVDAAAKLVGVR